MAKADAIAVDAGGRELRVSNPDRVIFPKTERTAETAAPLPSFGSFPAPRVTV